MAKLEEQYSYFVRSTGFPLGDAGMLAEPKPSPYLYDEHALIYYCNDLPHPTKEREGVHPTGGGAPVQLLEISHGWRWCFLLQRLIWRMSMQRFKAVTFLIRF